MSGDINVQTFSGKVNINNNLKVGSGHLFVDTLNNQVGLNTNDPQANLHVNGNTYVHTNFRVGSDIEMNVTAGRIKADTFEGDGTHITGINSDSGSWVNGTDVVYLSTIGDKVGIGVNPPLYKLDVDGDINISTGSQLRMNGTPAVFSNWDVSGGDISRSSGNVGIGTTDPQSKLHVLGTISTGRNLAREVGSVISYSSQLNTSRGAANVINGDKNFELGSNDWLTLSAQRVNAYVVIDLGVAYTVDRVVIYNQNEYSNSRREVKQFTLQGSTNNSTWVDVIVNDCGRSNAHEPNPGWSFRIPQDWDDDTEGSTSYRYWKFIMNTFHGTDGYGGIMELELYEAVTSVDDEISTSSLVAQDVYSQTGNFSRGVTIGKGYGGTSTGENNLLVEGTVTANTRLTLSSTASIRQNSTSPWSGDPGSGVGKLEYHSNRWYVVAGSNSTKLLVVRRNSADKFVVENDGSLSVGIVPAARISGTVSSATNQSGGTVTCTSGTFSGTFSASSASSRDKFRVYPSSAYCIGMQSGVTYGDLNDWAMTFQMNNENDRGFWWGDQAHGVHQGAMALSTRGYLNVANRIKVGGGETDTGTATHTLDVNGTAHISSSLECDGRIYADNGCHVRGDWLRVNGDSGIYWENHGGGWNMIDSTFIRNYGSKILRLGNGARIYGTEATLDYTNAGSDYLTNGGNVQVEPPNLAYGLYVDKTIRARGITVFSDQRIKSNVVDINDTTALDQVRLLKPKYYEYVDKVNHGSSSVIGFIAQEVKEVLPRAVSVADGDIPNIYEIATISSNNTVTFTNFNTSNLEGTNCTLIAYLAKDERKEIHIMEVIDDHTVRVEEDMSEWGAELFVWGQKVDNFHHLNKDYIFTVATAALQELDAQLQAEKEKTQQLEVRLSLLESTLASLIS